MYKTKKEVDAHVRTALSKIRTETERHLRSFTIAKLYYKVNEFATAEQYLCSYLSVKEDNDQAHKLLGQCYQRLKKPDKALQSFQRSLQLNPKQSDVLAEVCQLLLDDKNLNSNKAKYWCELAESEKVQNEAVFSLRLKLMNKDNLGTNQVEELIQKEISARPNDVQLRVRLVRNYVEKNQILDAFKYVHQLEMSHKDEFVTSSEWYNVVWLVLNKYEQMPNTKKDWDFWLLLAICLERQVHISFSLTAGTSLIGGGVTETANLLFNLDQYLFKISQLSEKFCAQKELVELFLEHYRGQLLLHATALIFKRELLQNKNKWKETTRAVLPLLMLAYQIEAPDTKEPWMKHCDEQSKQLIALWQREGSFRCAQMGRTLLSCINDDPAVNKENAHNINNLLGSQSSSLWNSNDELLSQVRQTCSDRQWRKNIFALLFCNSDQKVKEQSSLFAKSPKLSEPLYELPTYADIERYEDAAQYLRPQSLQHMVYLCLGNENLAYVKAKYFSGLNFSTQNLSFCGAESLNQLDVDSFLYAATIQAKRALEVDREAFDNYQSGNSTAAGKPKILPFVNIQNLLCSEEQSQWWQAAYMVYKNLSNGSDLAELRASLQYGIEAVRGINGPKLDMAIVFKLGQLFVARAQDIVKPIEKAFLEARAESIYKYGLNMMKMHNKGVLEPFRKYFKYAKSQSSAAERDLAAAAEDAVSYLATRYFKKSEYEDLIEELTGIQLPFATYLQAEAYRKLDEASKTPKKTKRMYLDRASDCLNQTLALLKSSAHADPNHPLNSVIHSEIKRLQQASARYLNDSNTVFSPNSIHNNSSTYEDAEEDFYAENPILAPGSIMNSTRARRETISNANALMSSHNLEMENLVKQMANTLTMLKDEIMETLKPELRNVTKEISSLKEKLSSVEDAMKKMRISSNPPSRDDASNVLDDLYLIEDTLQQQLYQQQQQQTNANQYAPNAGGVSNGPNMMSNSPFMAQQQRLQAAAYNSPMFPPNPHNYPMNFYGHPNQPNPYIMTPQPGAPPINQRPGPLPSLPYLEPTVPVPPAGLNFNMQASSTPLLPPPNQPPAPLAVEPNRTSNLYNLLQQPPVSITPNITNISAAPPTIPTYANTPLTHTTSMSMPVPAANTAPINITPTTTMQFHKTLNNQPVEKGPPANVVITSSDPLPNPNSIPIQSQQQTPLSVTIPSHHIKPSLVSQAPPQQEIAPLANNKTVTTTVSSTTNTFGVTIATSTFSFKPQIAAAAAQANNASQANDTLNKTSESLGSDFNRSGNEEIEYDPRPDFKPIIPLPDEIEVRTGEEDEEVMFCHRAKLFRHLDKEWKERGIGDIKILKNKEGSSRILMRRDQTHKICANHVITPELVLTVPKNETKGFIWAANDFADESLQLEKFFVRFKLPETAKQFQEAFKKAQKEAEEKTTVTATKKEEKPKVTTAVSNTTAPFSLAKSNVTNFVTSTPAPKSETGFAGQGKAVFGQPITPVPATTAAANTQASKSLFSGLNLSTKSSTNTETPNKPATTNSTTASPFANFTFGKPAAAPTAVTPAVSVAKVTTTSSTASPFASIFSNLSTSPFTSTPSTTTTISAAVIPTTVNETANASNLNKSTASDNEDEYVPTAQFNPVIPLPDLVEVNTGEENEVVLFEHRAKLLRFDKEAGEWKERGLGNIKLLQDKDDINKVRLVMRREQIHKLCCNQRIYKDTSFKYAKNSKTALSWAGQDFSENELVTEMLTVRFKLPETCAQFLEAIQKAQALMNSDGEEATSKANEKKKESADAKPAKGFGDAFKPKAGSWSCEACYISNPADQLYCVACDTPKDNTVPKKEANSSILATSSNTKFSFGFGAASPAAGQTPAVTSKPTLGFGTPTATTTSAKSKDTAAPVAGGFGDAFKPKAGSWTCQGCYLSNEGDAIYCKACDAPKDDTVPKKDANTNILALSNPSQKFSFGFGSPATASTTPKPNEASTPGKAPATAGFGDAFKPKAGSWTCQGCYLSNTADVVYCSACDAPKDDTIPKKDANTNILALSNPSSKFSFGFAATPVTATDSSKSFTFTPPTATSTTLNSTPSTTANAPLGKSTFSFSLSSKAMESPAMPGAGGESTPNTFSLDKKEFSFTLKPKSPGKVGKSPLKFGGAGGDADGGAGDDDGEAEYHEEEENNTYFTPVIPLPDKIEVKTGEEDEELLYVHRAKLYRFIDGEWKERGLGNVKILRHKENKKLRVVMRREQILKICLNHVLNEDVDYKRKDDKSWLFVVNDFSEGEVELEKFSLRFKTKEVAEEFMATVKKALDGTAEVIESPANTSMATPTNNTQASTTALGISEEDKKKADKLKLPHEFFATKPACTGCRGCDPDKFVFADVKNLTSFVNKEDTQNPLEVMELPALTINKTTINRTLLKQSPLSKTNVKADTTKMNDSIFSGFGGANSTAFTPSATENPANTTFSFAAALNSTTKPAEEAKTFGTAGSGGFLFGSAATTATTNVGGGSIFGGSAKENTLSFSTTTADKTATKSIFGGSSTNTSSAPIFGGKPVFGSSAPVFGSTATTANDTTKSIFGNSGNTTQSGGNGTGNSIFGSSTNTTTGFGGFGSNNTQGSIFGSSSSALPTFGSLAKDTNTTPSSVATGTTFADLCKTSTAAVDFASLAAKTNANTPQTGDKSAFVDLSKTSTASIDFASLAKAGSNSNSFTKSTDKPGPGGFIGLTHQNAFSNFSKPQAELDASDKNASTTKANESQKSVGGGEGGGDDNEENYDPHYDPIIELPNEVVVSTGEEEETKLFGERAVLYRWDATNKEWKERGVGELKLLLHPAKQSYRLVMRREQIHKLVLNHAVNADFHFNNMNNNPKSFVWATLNYAESNEGELEKLAVRFKKVELAEAFSKHLNDCIENCKKRENN
ncbi:RANBP2-like and GRIP domain-containing protein 1 [Lucilia cuprina]|nr:RANBP2-like and GRIP domain-containing protein 1 [Lucilia cuprina]